jgi:hypothetical protein
VFVNTRAFTPWGDAKLVAAASACQLRSAGAQLGMHTALGRVGSGGFGCSVVRLAAGTAHFDRAFSAVSNFLCSWAEPL